jgi:hypothetical protein
MNNSNSSTRPTLKLKAGVRRAETAVKTNAVPPAENKAKQKAGAHWSDEYKERMQADMDALLR